MQKQISLNFIWKYPEAEVYNQTEALIESPLNKKSITGCYDYWYSRKRMRQE